ncbi:MAG: PspA/IM30 family protein [Xanthomonadales bacterium]
MGAFSRLRYVIAANVNALIEKAEDPEKLLRALIREMEDASEEARMASADLLAEQQHLERLEGRLSDEVAQWCRRAENAVTENHDDLARAALKAKAEIAERHETVTHEQELVRDRVAQMEQDMLTLKSKLADAKVKLKGMYAGKAPRAVIAERKERLTPGERKIRRAMDRFDHLQAQVENLEARVRSYEVGGPTIAVWNTDGETARDPAVELELEKLKQRISGETRPEEATTEDAATEAAEPAAAEQPKEEA